MNLQALAAMDDCEHATGKTLAQHIKETPREIIREALEASGDDIELDQQVSLLLGRLKFAGYHLVQVVQTGNKPFP